MSCKLVLLIAAVILGLTMAEEEFPGKLVRSSHTIAPFSTFPQTCNGTGVYTTCNSCKSALVCIQGINDTKHCPTEKPYCNKNVCSDSLSSEYECLPESLTCTGVGFYPDPRQCQLYHYCEAVNEPSFVYDCQPGNVFNPVTSKCKPKRQDTDCMSVTCDPSKLLQNYGTSKTYFGYCADDGEIRMMKCDPNYVFTGTGCQFKCPKKGSFPHPDPTKYNECYFKLISEEVSCPEGMEFNAENQACHELQ